MPQTHKSIDRGIRCASFQMDPFHLKDPPEGNVAIIMYRNNRPREFILDASGVTMARHGLVLWANGAVRLSITFKQYVWPPKPKSIWNSSEVYLKIPGPRYPPQWNLFLRPCIHTVC